MMQIPITINGTIIEVLDVTNVTGKTPVSMRPADADVYHVTAIGRDRIEIVYHDRPDGPVVLAAKALKAWSNEKDI